jgi:hypothetical protein
MTVITMSRTELSRLVFVDDATSRLMHLSFVASESAFAYFQATRAYLEDHGKPIALYSDKHSVFQTNKPEQSDRHLSVALPAVAQL